MSETTLESPELDNQSVTVERATPDDAEAIMTLKRAAWLSSYVSEAHGVTAEDIDKKFGDLATATRNWQGGIASETEGGDRMTFVARVNGKVAGYTSPYIEDGQRRVGALYVAPDEQGKGIGSQLLHKAIEWHGRSEDIYLHVVSYNDNAIRLYEHFGFQKTGVETPEQIDEQGTKLLAETEMVLKAEITS